MPDLVTRIPSEDIDQCDQWLLPDVSSKQKVKATKRHAKKRPKKIIPEKNLDKVDSQERIEDVNNEEVSVEPITAEQLQKITEDAEKEGYEVGYEKGLSAAKEDGFKQGMDEAKAKIDSQVEDLIKILDALSDPLATEYEQLEEQLINMTTSLTRKIIHRELQLDSSIITQTVKQSLPLLVNKEQGMTIFLNQQDVEIIKESIGKEFPTTYEVSDDILPGGCRLQTSDSFINLEIEKNIEELLENFINSGVDTNKTSENQANQSDLSNNNEVL